MHVADRRVLGLRAAHRRVPDGPVHPGLRPRRHPPRASATPATAPTSSWTPPRTSPAATAPTGAPREPTSPPTAPGREQPLMTASHERRTPDRPVRQDPAPRDRPRARPGLPQGDRAVRRARALPRARAHLPAHPARPLERPRRRPRRRAGRRHAAGLQPLRRPARPARRHRRDDGPLRPAPPRQAPDARPGADQHRPAGARGGAARQEDQADDRRAARRATVVVHPSERGNLKQALLKIGWPAEDFAGYVDGEAHADRPRPRTAGRCGPTSRRPPSRSGTAARASWCCPAAPARRSSARPRWRRPRRPR